MNDERDVHISRADQIVQHSFTGLKAASVNIATSVVKWGDAPREQIRGLRVKKCTAAVVVVGPAILRDCIAEDSRTTRHFAFFYGTAFDNCVLRGNCGRVWIEDAAKLTLSWEDTRRAIAKANQEHYERTEMALDISEAWFTDLELHDIPIDKIVTDPDRQLKCSYRKTQAFIRSVGENPQAADAVALLAAHVERRSTSEMDFIIASPKSGAGRKKFELLHTLCCSNGLLV